MAVLGGEQNNEMYKEHINKLLEMAGISGATVLEIIDDKPTRSFFSSPDRDAPFLIRTAKAVLEAAMSWVPLAVCALETAVLTVFHLFAAIYELVNQDTEEALSNLGCVRDLLTATCIALIAAALSPLLSLVDWAGAELSTLMEGCDSSGPDLGGGAVASKH